MRVFLLNLIILAFLAWCAYKLIRMVIEAVKIANKQAQYLEQQFGLDVIAAARYQLGQPGAAGTASNGPNREHDDG